YLGGIHEGNPGRLDHVRPALPTHRPGAHVAPDVELRVLYCSHLGPASLPHLGAYVYYSTAFPDYLKLPCIPGVSHSPFSPARAPIRATMCGPARRPRRARAARRR